jgi:hypothetical protein
MFYCHRPAEVGGESLLVRSADITKAMDADFIELLRAKKGIRNTLYSPSRQAKEKAKGDPSNPAIVSMHLLAAACRRSSQQLIIV